MRPTTLCLLLSAALLFGCQAHTAYGPSGDDRLESATNERPSDDGADAAGLRCTELQPRLREAKNEDKPETERLKLLVELYGTVQERTTRLDDAIARNPDLVYSAQGDAIRSNQEECRSVYADVRSDLDRYVREIVDLPVIQEVHGRQSVNVARLDFTVLRGAISALDPDDKDVLVGKVDDAEKRVEPRKGR